MKRTTRAFAVLACVAIALTALAAQWTDPSPHELSSVTAQPGIALEVLDWGGTGLPLIFLAGLGSTAHVFDDFAPRFRDRYHVLAITRRGYHGSSRPDTGYDYPTLARDIKGVCDALGLDRVVLAGHSMAGAEMTRVASLFPERLRALVYLDAAYDFTEKMPWVDLPEDRATSDDMRSLPRYIRYLARTSGAVFPEADVRATVVMGADGRVLRREAPPAVWKALEAADEHQAWKDVTVPALAIYSATDARSMFPTYEKLRPQDRRHVDTFVAVSLKYKNQMADRFRREAAHATVVRLTSGAHHVFLTNADEVERLMREFLERALAR